MKKIIGSLSVSKRISNVSQRYNCQFSVNSDMFMAVSQTYTHEIRLRAALLGKGPKNYLTGGFTRFQVALIVIGCS